MKKIAVAIPILAVILVGCTKRVTLHDEDIAGTWMEATCPMEIVLDIRTDHNFSLSCRRGGRSATSSPINGMAHSAMSAFPWMLAATNGTWSLHDDVVEFRSFSFSVSNLTTNSFRCMMGENEYRFERQ